MEFGKTRSQAARRQRFCRSMQITRDDRYFCLGDKHPQAGFEGLHLFATPPAALGKKNEDRLPIQQPLAQFAESVVTAVAATAPERQRVQCDGCKGGAERLFKEY